MSLKKQYPRLKQVCKVTFSLPKEAANGAKEVRVLGDFNDWDWSKGKLMKAKKGEYTTIIELPKNQAYQFRYALDNEQWENDWEADGYAPSPFGVDNSIVNT